MIFMIDEQPASARHMNYFGSLCSPITNMYHRFGSLRSPINGARFCFAGYSSCRRLAAVVRSGPHSQGPWDKEAVRGNEAVQLR